MRIRPRGPFADLKALGRQAGMPVPRFAVLAGISVPDSETPASAAATDPSESEVAALRQQARLAFRDARL
ncbi:hypothetical protein GCM10027569_24970 [Flindersiella endophytica]